MCLSEGTRRGLCALQIHAHHRHIDMKNRYFIFFFFFLQWPSFVSAVYQWNMMVSCSWTTNRLYCGMSNTCIGQSHMMSACEQRWGTIEDVHCLVLWQLTLPETTAECHISIRHHWPLSFHWAGLLYRDYKIQVKDVHLNKVNLRCLLALNLIEYLIKLNLTV